MDESKPSQQQSAVSLYLRVDGTLLLVRGSQVVEIALTAKQLLALGMDALNLAATNDPLLLQEVADVLATSRFIVPMEKKCPNLN